MPGRLVPPIPTARSKFPVRIHSAYPDSGFAPFNPSQLAKVVENWNKYQKNLVPGFPDPAAAFVLPPATVGLGHEEDQSVLRMILGRTDLPAAGHPVNLFISNGEMFADLDGMPLEVAAMANAGLLKSVSVQIYPDYVGPGGKHFGPVLKRIDLIGAAQPRQKGLGRLPPFVFSEACPSVPGAPAQNYVLAFTEPTAMDRQEIINQLTAAGVDVSTVTDAVPTEFLQSMLAVIQAAKGIAPANGGAGGSAAGGAVPAGPLTFSEQSVLSIMARHLPGMLSTAIAPVVQSVQGIAQQVQATSRESERQQVVAFCEQNRNRIFPFELDPKVCGAGNTLVDQLLALPNDAQSVISFSEPNGQTVSLTRRQAAMRTIAQRPPHCFAETMTATGGRPVMGAGHSLSGPLPTNPNDVAPQRVNELLNHSALGRAIAARKATSNN